MDTSADSVVVSAIGYRHCRVGNLPYVIYFAGCLAALAALLLIAGAILTAVVFTEVRPPTADENYQRYIGADFRRVVGPLMMTMSALMLILGCGVAILGYVSSTIDRDELRKAEQQRGDELQKLRAYP